MNCSPQGPWAIPPRHGQSQLISPVSGLYAPCWPPALAPDALLSPSSPSGFGETLPPGDAGVDSDEEEDDDTVEPEEVVAEEAAGVEDDFKAEALEEEVEELSR